MASWFAAKRRSTPACSTPSDAPPPPQKKSAALTVNPKLITHSLRHNVLTVKTLCRRAWGVGLSRHVGDVGSAQPRTTAHRDPKEVTAVAVSTHSWHINGTFTVTPVDQPVWHPDGGPQFDADSAMALTVLGPTVGPTPILTLRTLAIVARAGVHRWHLSDLASMHGVTNNVMRGALGTAGPLRVDQRRPVRAAPRPPQRQPVTSADRTAAPEHRPPLPRSAHTPQRARRGP